MIRRFPVGCQLPHDESVGSEVWCDIHESFRKTSPEHVLYRYMPVYKAGRNRSSTTSHQLRDRTVARILCRSFNPLETNKTKIIFKVSVRTAQ